MSDMNERPNATVLKWCLYSGPIGVIIWMVGFTIFSTLLVPAAPSLTATELANHYFENLNGIRAGLLMSMIGPTMFAPFCGAICIVMKHIEGKYAPLAYTQLAVGIGGALLFIGPCMNLQAGIYRPERSVELIELASDMFWIPYVGAWMFAAMQNALIGVCVFSDKSQNILPRWYGFFNLWLIPLYTPGSLLYFFKTGPFAWNGMLTWYMVVTVYCTWYFVTLAVFRKAIIKITS